MSSTRALWDAYNELRMEEAEAQEELAVIQYRISVIEPLLSNIEHLDLTDEVVEPHEAVAETQPIVDPTAAFYDSLIGLSQPEALRKIAEKFDVVEVKDIYPILVQRGICNASPHKAASALARAATRANMVRVAPGVYKVGK